jgi:DNA-binding transcriptional ArsR family regulator
MNLSRSARGFMWFLQQRANKTGQSWWGQDKMARELGVHVRTIGRWVRELREAGKLDSIRRGSTSNLYTLRITAVENVPLVRSDQTKCPNVSIELNLEQEKRQAPLAFPEPTITNEYGRTEPNPEFQRIQAILRGAQERVRRARNPAAYERAIIQAELRALRKPAATAGHSFGAQRSGS